MGLEEAKWASSINSDDEHPNGAADKMLSQIGQMARSLYENLRDLGYDKALENAASAIPDARDRLAYVAKMTEQAAERVLNATDIAKPLQDELVEQGESLTARWDKLFAGELNVAGFKQLAYDTRTFVAETPKRARSTSAQLMEIMMAQDFQDLTGLVIKKTTALVQDLEQQLLKVLLDNVPKENRPKSSPGSLDGPVVKIEEGADVVTSQAQVDDLLASLGF